MENITIKHHDLQQLVANENLAAVGGVSCEMLDTTIAVLTQLQGSVGNMWVKMGLGIAAAAVTALKAAKSCP